MEAGIINNAVRVLMAEHGQETERLELINQALEAHRKIFGFGENLPDSIAQSVAKWQQIYTGTKKRIERLNNAIETYQSLCTHRHPDGSDAWVMNVGHNYKYRECAVCLKKEDLR